MLLGRCINTFKRCSLNWGSIVCYIILLVVLPASRQAEAEKSVVTEEISEDTQTVSPLKKLKDYMGVTYFSIFNGPGLIPDQFHYSPNNLGKSSNGGLNLLNQFSIRLKFFDNLALDLQNRFYLIFNNATQKSNFQQLRWEAPRVGISGRLLSGNDWSLTGAINTDFPYFFPTPISGYQVQQRTVIFDPGMFARFKYEPKFSRWTIYSVVNPRFYLYRDRLAAEPEFFSSGYTVGNKPELILSFQPTVNYRLTHKLLVSIGSVFDYRKYIRSSWNMFNGSLITNGNSDAWRLAAVPIMLGLTYEFSADTLIFPYLTAYPIAKQRLDAESGYQASFLESTSVGLLLSGTLF